MKKSWAFKYFLEYNSKKIERQWSNERKSFVLQWNWFYSQSERRREEIRVSAFDAIIYQRASESLEI